MENDMSELNFFLKQNKVKRENTKYAASDSFFNPTTGKPVEWEIRPLRSGEADTIRMQCSSYDKKGNRKVDEAKFNRIMASRCTVYPDLNDIDLQNSYGVLGAENLIEELLDRDGEFQSYIQVVTDVSGYNISMEELVQEAKN